MLGFTRFSFLADFGIWRSNFWLFWHFCENFQIWMPKHFQNWISRQRKKLFWFCKKHLILLNKYFNNKVGYKPKNSHKIPRPPPPITINFRYHVKNTQYRSWILFLNQMPQTPIYPSARIFLASKIHLSWWKNWNFMNSLL